METVDTARRKTGRPLSFDREAALDKAMLAFWRGGYETTSVADLTKAMGLTPPSLYAAFGNKQHLFLAAMLRYAGDRNALDKAFQRAPTARDAVRVMLQNAVVLFTGEVTPPGCLLASAAASGSAEAEPVRQALAADRRMVRDIVRRRIVSDIATGTLAPGTPSEALADLVVAVVQGLSVLARDGADRKALQAVADAALHSWSAYEI